MCHSVTSRHREGLPISQMFLVFSRHAADVDLEAKSTMKLASPSFTGVLPVAVRTRVCGMQTDIVHCCFRSVIASRDPVCGGL